MAERELAAEVANLRLEVSELRASIERLTESRRYRVQLEALAFSVPRAAELAGIGANAFRAMVDRGEVRSIACGPLLKKRVVPLSALEEFLERREKGARDEHA